MTMLEKVARAICLESICDPKTIDPADLPGYVDHWWPEHIKEARAALEAMLEPTEAMEDAMVSESGSAGIAAYESMIQAALDGK